MNCKNCKKKICKGYNGKVWFDWNDDKYCEKQFFKIKYKDPVETITKLIEKSICHK